MNKTGIKAYFVLLAALMSTSIQAMETGSSSGSSSSALGALDEENIFTLQISTARNTLGLRSYEEILKGSKEDPILLSAFTELIAAKHAKKDPYFLARTMEQVEDGLVVNYFDAHALNEALFGNCLLKNLRNLWECKNPVSNVPMQCLDYYECAPGEKLFTHMCTYAVLRSADKAKRDFYLTRLRANQDEDLSVAAVEKFNLGYSYETGRGVRVDHAKAFELYQEVADQKDHSYAAAAAKFNLGNMYRNGQGVPVNYEKAFELYQQVVDQKDHLSVAAAAKGNLGAMYENGKGVPVNYPKAFELYEQVASQKDNLSVAARAKDRLEALEKVMKNKND